MMPFHKYKSFPTVDLKNRQWPNKTLTKAPIWCSVDLRDGNQALINPMSVEQKLIFFEKLVDLGFKEIEVGFPAASKTEYSFIRRLITENKIPEDVTIQVLCQARNHLIDKTIESLQGCKRAIFHLYNSTSTLQRRVVFGLDRKGIQNIATSAIEYLKSNSSKLKHCDLVLEYSPESFTGTELDFSLEVLTAVMETWSGVNSNKVILNLPATVEMCTPNIYADMIEWIIKNLSYRDQTIISLHTHNDRGTAVAATELALLAGADRVEGTLFGNGERTGNVDIITLACNLYSQGVNPELDFCNIDSLNKLCQELTKIEVHPRHPYAGSLVYTAFSGSHQDAIRKGMAQIKEKTNDLWEVPYLPIDPQDLGRAYEPIRINSQSGKGGVAFVLENLFGYRLPKEFHPHISHFIQLISEKTGKEVTANKIKTEFEKQFVNLDTPLKIKDFVVDHLSSKNVSLKWHGHFKDEEISSKSDGIGPISAFCNSLIPKLNLNLEINEYFEHTMGHDSEARAASYVIMTINSTTSFGVGVHPDTIRSAFYAIVSAINNHLLNKF